MKRKLFLTFACLTFFVRAIYAQDIITTFDGKDIKAKVEEVNTEYVKYKKFGSPDGTSFLINSSDIFMIKYIIDEYSYETDVFERNPVTQQILIKHSVIRVPESVKASRNPVSTEPASNGVFEIFAFDGASVSFRAVVATPIYSVSQVSGGRTIEAVNVPEMLLPKNTEIRCRFENIPAGFVAQTIVFLTGETAAPMSYDIATGKWIKPEPPVVSTNPPVVSTNPPAVSTNPSAVSTNPPAVSTGSSAVSTGSPGVPKVSPNPRPQKSSNDIVDLLENNILEVEIAGGNITYVNLRVRRLVPEVVNVTIPAGSFFVSDNPAAQNMVATAEKKTRLTTDGWVSISMPAACANRPKDIPDGNDKFRVQRSPNQDELTRLMPALGKSNATILVKQAAVWIVTDDADFDDLGILTTSPGNTRAIWYETTARAMKICAEAGIDITKKRIWRDKETIVSKLSAGELKNWLQNFGVPKTT